MSLLRKARPIIESQTSKVSAFILDPCYHDLAHVDHSGSQAKQEEKKANKNELAIFRKHELFSTIDNRKFEILSSHS